MYKVTIDAGHDRYSNVSPVDRSYIEGVRMWKLGCFLKDALEDYGIEVILTRPTLDSNPDIPTRGKMAAQVRSDVFISLHSNAPAPRKNGTYDTSITGTAIYYSLTDEDNRELADKLGAAIAGKMGHPYRGSMTRAYSEERPNWDWYGVIRNAAQNGCTAAYLIEHGFHTNKEDIAFLMSDEKLAELANEEARIIAEHLGVAKKLYRIQVGAFSSRKNADSYCEKVRKDGYSAFVVEA